MGLGQAAAKDIHHCHKEEWARAWNIVSTKNTQKFLNIICYLYITCHHKDLMK